MNVGIHFDKYLTNISYVHGTVLGNMDTMMNGKPSMPLLGGSHSAADTQHEPSYKI